MLGKLIWIFYRKIYYKNNFYKTQQSLSHVITLEVFLNGNTAIYIYIYIFVMSILPVCGIKHTSRILPGACDTSLEPSRQKKLIQENKNPASRAPHALRVRKRVQLTT